MKTKWTRHILKIWYYLHKFFPKVSVEPAVEDGVADTGAHGEGVAEAEAEVVVAGVRHGDEAQVRHGEEEVEGEGGEHEGDRDGGQHHRHPPVPLPLLLLPPGVQSKPGVGLEEF